MKKEALRKGMMAALVEIGDRERKLAEQALHKQLFASFLWKEANTIGITLSQDLEWDTRGVVQKAWKEGKRVCVPKSIHQTRELHFYEIESFDQVEKGYYDIEEPIVKKAKKVEKQEIDTLLVPGVVFNKKGYRIGFGGGYYDRFLEDYEGRTLSLVHTNQLVENLPVESHDIPVQFMCTEKNWIDCTGH